MAILTMMNGVPLFSDVKEAVTWAKFKRLRGYHVHYWQGQKGYMGGFTHAEAMRPVTSERVYEEPQAPIVQPTQEPIPQPTYTPPTPTPTPTPTPAPTPTPYVSGGSTGGGGGY